jgi:predicted DNA-binding transcriptional regulator AlpA
MQPIPNALTINAFCATYGIGRSLVYEEIKCGRLQARKVGARTVILRQDAEAWARSLPVLGARDVK